MSEGRPSDKLLELSTRVDEFEGYSRPHRAPIAAIAGAVASHFNLSSDDRTFLKQAAYLHDIGEVVMGRDYISAFRTLNQEERLDVQRHPVIGEQEVARLGLPSAASSYLFAGTTNGGMAQAIRMDWKASRSRLRPGYCVRLTVSVPEQVRDRSELHIPSTKQESIWPNGPRSNSTPTLPRFCSILILPSRSRISRLALIAKVNAALFTDIAKELARI